MSNIFLVTSAIHGPGGMSGRLSSDERIMQTVDTAISIRKHIPDAKIYLLEGGIMPLNMQVRQMFLMHYDDILDYSISEFIQFAHRQRDAAKQEITVIKGPCESYMLREACKILTTTVQDRIFKISGRYQLSDEFNLQAHAVPGKYIFKTKEECLKWYADKESPVYSPYQYKTRLYSWCGSLKDIAIVNFDKVMNNILELYSRNLYMDVEHMTYLTIDPSLVQEITPVGLTGSYAEVPDSIIKE
jgi:hypothetical protein